MNAETESPPANSEWFPGLNWVRGKWARVRLGHEAMMLGKIQQQNRIAQINARNAMTGDMTNTDGWPGEDGDDMGVNVGDVVHHHHYAPPEAPTPKRAMGIVPKLALAAILFGGGGAGALGLVQLFSLWPKPTAVTIPADSDTLFELHLGDGK